MESLTSGTMAGTGSFRCEACGYVVTLGATEKLGACAGCGANDFARASLFAAGRFQRQSPDGVGEREALLIKARAALDQDVAHHVAYLDGDELQVVPLTRDTVRIGRSLSAEIRFDDPTVSRRHALLVQREDGVHVLDDRSMNGVFVGGERVTSLLLHDGDEVVIGRHRLLVLLRDAQPAAAEAGVGVGGLPAG